MESGNIAELADPRLEGRYDEEQLYRVVLTASYCVRQTDIWRPPMSEVNKQITVSRNCHVLLSSSLSQQDSHSHFHLNEAFFCVIYTGVGAAN